MKTLQDTLAELTIAGYEAASQGGDIDCAVVDRAALLAKNVSADGKELEELKAQLRFFSDEIGERVLHGNNSDAHVTEATKPTKRLDSDRVTKLLTKLCDDGVLSRYMLDSCWTSKMPAHKVTFVKK